MSSAIRLIVAAMCAALGACASMSVMTGSSGPPRPVTPPTKARPCVTGGEDRCDVTVIINTQGNHADLSLADDDWLIGAAHGHKPTITWVLRAPDHADEYVFDPADGIRFADADRSVFRCGPVRGHDDKFQCNVNHPVNKPRTTYKYVINVKPIRVEVRADALDPWVVAE